MHTSYRVYFRDKNKNFKIEKIVALNKIQEKIIKAVDKKLISQQFSNLEQTCNRLSITLVKNFNTKK